MLTFSRRSLALTGISVAAVALALSTGVVRSAPAVRPAQQATAAPTAVPVGGTFQADNACYARLADIPPTRLGAGTYGGHGAYNPKTGVLAYVGGADKASDENTYVFSTLFGIKLDGVATKWTDIPYSKSVGYNQAFDKGCRELASIQMSDTDSVSVLGKDGCNNNEHGYGSSGGDIRQLTVGASANSAGVRWVSGSGAPNLPGDLGARKGALVRLMAAWDSQRSRIVFGQGTFNDEQELESQDKIYAAKKVGSSFQVSQLRPTGDIPKRRFGTCAAYIHDADAGVDGVFVLGGQEGAPENIPATTYAEVWWLDFKAGGTNGEWMNISSRFTNLVKDNNNPTAPYLGGRREGACAYDRDTKTFYSWMGRASGSIPDGSSHSSGAWRVNLAQLGDATATLTWERLAKDNTKALKGRRLIPSVWDPVNKRMFAIAGRNGIDAYQDVWAIYPDITGEACATLDPYAPFRPGAPTPTPLPGPSETPGPTPTGGSGPTPAPTAASPQVCPQLTGRVPDAVVADALANPADVKGWGMPANGSLPVSPYNPLRTRLSMMDYGKQFHPIYNSVVFKAGCP